MKVLFIGGTRFTGPFAVRRLVEMGHEVSVFHRGRSEADLPPGVHHIHGDRLKLAEHAQELRGVRADVVVHMMALTEEDANVFVETFRGAAGRGVVISSCDVYRAFGRIHRTEPGPPDPAPLTEESPLREKLSVHGKAYDKTAVERVVMSEPRLPAVVLRYPAVYGPGDGQHRLFQFLKRMDDGRPFILLSEAAARWRFSHGYCEDVAQAVVLAATAERASGRIYNVAERETPRWSDWVREIGRAAGWKGEVVTLPPGRMPTHLVEYEDLAQELAIDSTRIRRELGYSEVVEREESVRQTVEWERDNPPTEVDPKQFDYAAEDAAKGFAAS